MNEWASAFYCYGLPHYNTFSESALSREYIHGYLIRSLLTVCLEVIAWRKFRIDNRKSLYFNHDINADKMRNLKLKILLVCLLPIISASLRNTYTVENSPCRSAEFGTSNFLNVQSLFVMYNDWKIVLFASVATAYGCAELRPSTHQSFVQTPFIS